MNRNQIIQDRADAIMNNPVEREMWFATSDLLVRRSALYRFIRAVGHWAYLLTVGEYRGAL